MSGEHIGYLWATGPTDIAVGGGGGGGSGTATWQKFGGRDDGLLAKASASLSQRHDILPRFDATVSFTQVHSPNYQFNATASWSQRHDLLPQFSASLSNTFVLATADQLPDHDTYLNRSAGTTNYGTATGLLHKANTAVVNDDKNAYIMWDMTGLATGSVSSASVTLWTTHNSLTATAYNWEIYTHPTQPFNESTATWDADEPPPGTQRQSGSSASFASGGAYETITFDATARANMTGNWVYLRLVGSASALVTFTTSSKENATSADRPVLDMEITA